MPSTDRAPRAPRSLALIGSAAVAMLVADYAGSSLLLLALLGAPVLLVGIPLVAVTLAASLIALSKALMGRRSILGSIVVTCLLACVGAYGFANGVLELVWHADLPLRVLVCGLCALALGLFLGPWPIRAVGAAAVVVLMWSIPSSADMLELERAEMEAQQRQESIDYLLDDGARPLLAGLEGWSNPRIHPTGAAAMTWARSDTGAVATILVEANVREPVGQDWCHFIARPGDDGSATAGALPEWCVETANGWARSDGTGRVLYDDGRLIAINPAGDNAAAQVGGTSAATADDISSLADSLRPMSDLELEHYVLPVYDSSDTPVIDTPGL